MADTADGDGVGLNVFRQCHAAVAGVTQMMDVGAGHLAHQGDLANGGDSIYYCTF